MRAERIVALVVSFLLLLAFLFVGELASRLFEGAIPGSVLGLLLLFGSLGAGLLPERIVAPASELLLSHLGMLFVPPAVGLLLYVDRLRSEWLPLVAGTVVSFVLVLVSTAFVAQALEKGRGDE